MNACFLVHFSWHHFAALEVCLALMALAPVRLATLGLGAGGIFDVCLARQPDQSSGFRRELASDVQ